MEKDTNVYVKQGRKYEPIGYWWESSHEWLSEGVWIVTRRPGSCGTTSGNYAKKRFGLDKVSGLEKVNYAQIGDMSKTADEICSEYTQSHDYETGWSVYDVVCFTLGKIKEIQEKKED